ncbi:DNA polymerase III subunit gamma/tau [Gallaecimonas pentaromativorans]|uniref:DNA polymerase III subunit gamma/tau n=1 Tax=Gallaecimonas pentaromativorans TaxID=584787 RepID=A0A3N1PSP7_9GAMM|nr:DNA polymerase III subunit gamma/tau [Gallaecimonas pentaromativorans]ROQ30141.1 DNA polymerase III gamma subunit /DNA polymerase III tau subunit [Gallaecimonas pentaromativorans]
MAYQVLARKWRPQNFSALVGQEHVVRALNNALAQNRLHHAYLFTGTRGVGKTTLARIFAKSLNCETGITPTPCGQCSTCLEIERGNFVDLIEVDAASRTKVEDTREILDNVQYRPTRGRFKVYLIDEVHMLSRHSFNALLKTLEEPPEHVKFLLATTDPQKLPVTILSRCLQFNLKSLSPELITEHLAYVLGEEKLGFDEPALRLLAKAANGSMRDALSLTDQAIAHGNGEVLLDNVQSMLGTLDNHHAQQLMHQVVAADGQALLAAIEQVAMMSPDYNALLADILALLHQAAIAQQVPGSQEAPAEQLALQLSPQQLQLFYQMVLHGRRDLPYCPDPRMALEMTLLRMLAFDIDTNPGLGKAQAKAPSTAAKAALLPAKASMAPAAGAPRTPMTAPPVASQEDLDAQQAHLMAMAEAQGFRGAEVAEPPSQPLETQAAPQSTPPVQAVPEQGHDEPEQVQAAPPLETSPKAETPPKADAPQGAANPTSALLAFRQALKAKQQGQEDKGPKKPEAQLRAQPKTEPARNPTQTEERSSQPQPQPVAPERQASPGWDDAPPWLDEEIVEPDPGMQLAWAEQQQAQAPAAPEAPSAEPEPEPAVFTGQGGEPYPGVTLALDDAREDDRFWFECCERLNIGGFVRQLALNSVLEQHPEHWNLLLEPSQRHLERNLGDLQQALAQSGIFSGNVSVQVQAAPAGRESPLAIANRISQRCQAYAEQVLADDPRVNQFVTLFDAELVAESIRPIM